MKRDIFKYFLSAPIIPLCLQAKSFNKTSIPTVSSNANQFYRWEFFDGNRIKCTISNYGPFVDYRRTNSSGFFWSKGTKKTAIFTAGIWIAGIHRGTGEIRTAIQEFSSEYQPGPINGLYLSTNYDSTVLSNLSDIRYRVYKIKKGDNDSARDYREWPADLGAPYVDVNKNSRWDPGIDRPWNIRSQTLWSVYNDGNPKQHYFRITMGWLA